MEQEFFSSLVKLLDAGTIERLGIPFTITIIMMIFFYAMMSRILSREFGKLSLAIREVSIQASKPLIDKSGMMHLIEVTFEAHILKKLEITRETLVENHIDNPDRMRTIKKNIEGEFVRITKNECSKISAFNSEVGDAGKLIFDFIEWEKFFKRYFAIFQCSDSVETKLSDIKNLMMNYVQDIKNMIDDVYNNRTRSFEM